MDRPDPAGTQELWDGWDENFLAMAWGGFELPAHGETT
jgi:hypothetical protein